MSGALLVLVSPDGDAMRREAFELAVTFAPERRVLVLCPKADLALYRAAGIPARKWRPAGYFGMTNSVKELRRSVERHAPALVHAHGFPAIALALGTFPRPLARRTVVTFHEPQRAKELPRKLVDTRFAAYLSRAGAAIVTYPTLAASLGKRLGLPPETFAVIPHGVEEPDPAPLRRPEGRPGPIVGWFGSLAADRSWEIAIDGFGEIADRFPDARLHLAGTGLARQFVRAHVRQSKHANRVVFRGNVPQPELFASIDALVVPLSGDAQPVAPLAALLAGVPVIATDRGALTDALRDARTGWLVDDDPAGFALGIATAWGEIDAAWDAAAADRSRAVATYGRPAVARAYAAVYDQVATAAGES